MKIINASYKIECVTPDPVAVVESAARTCYKSTSGESFVPGDLIRHCIKRGHESVLEHAYMSVRFIVDRGVSHELVRHRLCSLSQESTRYCDYSKEKFDHSITFIKPCFWDEDSNQYDIWKANMAVSESTYFLLLNSSKPEEARSVLPNSTKTEVVMTANFREWRLVFKLRTSKAAHPQMREVMIPLFEEAKVLYPPFFKDIVLN